MLPILIVAFIIGILIIILGASDIDGEIAVLFGIIIAIVSLFMSFPLFQISTGEKTYTGYIYSAEDFFNRTVGHLRFSENAGSDEQPPFCAVKGSEQAQKIKELAGSGKKVKVTVPSGFVLQTWYGQCGIPATVEEM